VKIPPDMSADECFQRGEQAFAQHQNSVASAYMERSAALGNIRAQAALGLDYVNGTGEPKDLQKAVYWLTLAADKGHRVAQAQLGDLYEDGDGVPADLTKAFHYHKLGAEQRWWRAELRVGIEYELGYGTPQSRAQALMWLDRATQDGKDGFSQQLAIMLRRSDTPARFKDMDALAARFSQLVGQAYRDSLPKMPPGKNCREHFLGSGTSSAQSTYFCD
jgi:TPR repeat protein